VAVARIGLSEALAVVEVVSVRVEVVVELQNKKYKDVLKEEKKN
jgi:hypothetical protein